MHSRQKEFLWLNLTGLPYFRALLRAVEARFYQDFPLKPPVLDLGCGDGHFASMAFNEPIDVGIDPWWGPLNEASGLGAYRMVLQGNGAELPFPDNSFSSVISNSVLEHIPAIDEVLDEVARVLRPDGAFIFCVPNHNFTKELSISKNLDRFGLKHLAEAYRRWFNKISRHHHCDSPDIWRERLVRSGFEIDRCWHYFSPDALRVLEWGHYFGLPSLVVKKIFGRWILFPTRWNLNLIEKMLRSYYLEPSDQPKGAYTFYVTRKIG